MLHIKLEVIFFTKHKLCLIEKVLYLISTSCFQIYYLICDNVLFFVKVSTGCYRFEQLDFVLLAG